MEYLYPGGLAKAITFSYDDGQVYDRRLIEIFNQAGFKGTFHLNSGNLDKDGYVQKAELPTLYAGHEIACHGVTHRHPRQMNQTEWLREVWQVCFCFSRCPAERLICPSKTREIKEKNKRFHRLKFFSFSFCRYSCCFPKSLPSLPGRAGQGIDGLVSSRKSKSSPGTFPNYCK